MLLSLVVGSVNRTRELHELLESFVAQPCRNFEVIVVDQNEDDRLLPVLHDFHGQFPLTHLRSAVRNTSQARNTGLAVARGEIIGFPDDDCRFLPETMSAVMRHFSADPGLTVLAGNYQSPSGELVNGRWTRRSCAIDDRTVWTTIMGAAFWVRTAPAREVGGFDPSVGPGTQWGSSEEPDFVLNLLRRGYRGYYDVTLGVIHPDKRLSAAATERAFLYGAGMGRVLRKHRIAPMITLGYMLRPLGGLLVSLLRTRGSHARYYRRTLRGRIHGYLARPSR